MTTGLDQLDAYVAQMAQNLENCPQELLQEEYCRKQEDLTLWTGIAEVLHQLARKEKEKALAVVTHAQEQRMAQQREDPVQTCEENPEEEDTAGIQEVIPDMQVGDSIEVQRSGDEISVDCPQGIQFPFDRELFGKPGKTKVHST